MATRSFELTGLAKDDHPRVRLEAVRAIGMVKSAKAAELALTALEKPLDRTLDYALWLTVRELEPRWLPAFRFGTESFGGDAKKIAFALQASGNPETVPVTPERYQRYRQTDRQPSRPNSGNCSPELAGRTT